jgi:hypothetical protein
MPNVEPTAKWQALPTAYFFAPDLEREINRLDAVTSARVLSTGSEIQEIHVLATPERPPKKIVRDIESLLLVRFGLRVDHRCISIVHVEGVQTTYVQNQRPRIITIAREHDRIRAELGVGSNLFTGYANVTPELSEVEATARAVIHAIEQLLQTPGVLIIVKTSVSKLSDFEIVMVLVRWLFGEQHEFLVGATMVNDDPLDAAARATLDAINRRLVRFQAERTA